MAKDSDQGWTTLRGGRRVRKDHGLLEMGGELDELNSLLGAAAALMGGRNCAPVRAQIREIQAALLGAGCALGIAADLTAAIRALERSERLLSQGLPPLRGFLIPGGAPAGAWLHVARAVCRRAERRASGLPRQAAPLMAYLNRLSQWLFSAARWVNARQGRPELPFADGPKRR